MSHPEPEPEHDDRLMRWICRTARVLHDWHSQLFGQFLQFKKQQGAEDRRYFFCALLFLVFKVRDRGTFKRYFVFIPLLSLSEKNV